MDDMHSTRYSQEYINSQLYIFLKMKFTPKTQDVTGCERIRKHALLRNENNIYMILDIRKILDND